MHCQLLQEAGGHDPDLVCSDGRGDGITQPEGLDLPQDNNEAIVVGAPWFLTGWAEGTEVEFHNFHDLGNVGVRTNVYF